MSTSPNNATSPSDSSGLSGGATAATIILAIVGGVVLIVVTCSITKCYLKRLKRETRLSFHPVDPSGTIATTPLTKALSIDSKIELASIERFLDDIMKEKPIRFSPQHLIEFTNNYAEKLGSGGFGVVYKGRLPTGVQVAVKVLNGTLDKRAEEQFMAEVGTICRTYHINLVRLYGFCFEAAVKALVYEYMENGSLDQYLFGKDQKIEWEKLYDIAVGTAKGIRYLHEECQRKIVHYDIKPGNILLSANFSPKVADFGLAKLFDRENSHVAVTGGRGTPGYAAPELWMPYPVTHKCDVYSFGMLLFEVLGRRRNLEFNQAESQQWFPRWVWEKFELGTLDSIISLCGIEEKNREKAERMSKVALWCVQYQPEARPSMNSVVRMLEGEEEIVAPLNPFQHMVPYDSGSGSGSWSQSMKDSASRETAKNQSVESSSS